MGKSNAKVARKYARALLLATSPGELEATRDALVEYAKLWQMNSELRSSLLNPGRAINERLSLLREVGKMIRSDESFGNLLATLLENSRLGSINEVSSIFTDLVNELKKQLALEITSAFPVPASEQSEVTVRLTKDFGSLASVKWNVDPEILGGLKIKAGDRLLDGSIESALENLRTSLVN